MADPTVSLIIVSRHRPAALVRCLTGIAQLQYAAFEVIVVADPAGITAVQAMPGLSEIKQVPFDEANIAAARNAGIAQAAGEIVAFIDDDAVPEPTWLQHLVAPAARPDVAAMGGFVRGRNGISFQHRARTLDAWGHAQPVAIDPVQATVLVPPEGRAIKTEGTNMAVRREVLVALGGFDPAFRFYLDETDLNMRLARAGHATALVPLAEVHHGFAASDRRRDDRVPLDLFDIGASWAVFQRKHIPRGKWSAHWARVRNAERRRVLAHLVAGQLEPRDVRRLMRRLRDGYAEGQQRTFGQGSVPRHATVPFARFVAVPRASEFRAVRRWRARARLQDAAARVAEGTIQTVLVLSRTALFHSSKMNEDGVWVQRGGIFGRSVREGPLIVLTTFARRAKSEHDRMARVRGLQK